MPSVLSFRPKRRGRSQRWCSSSCATPPTPSGCSSFSCPVSIAWLTCHGTAAGRVFTEEELRKVGEFCERHDITIVSDEIHSDLILDEGLKHISMLALDNGVRMYVNNTYLDACVHICMYAVAFTWRRLETAGREI